MPTGYTAKLCEGEQSFEDFVLQCARGMGALIHMRDNDFYEPIKPREKSDYHEKAIIKAAEDLVRYGTASDAELQQEIDEAYDRDAKYFEERNVEVGAKRERLTRMIAKVKSWIPPTPDHEEFKKFMLGQLTETLEWDGKMYSTYPVKKDVETYRTEALAHAQRDFEYHTKEDKKETQRVNDANQWVKDLAQSLSKSS